MKKSLENCLVVPVAACYCLLLTASGFCKEPVTLTEGDRLFAAQANGQYSILILHRNDGQEVLESGVKEALAGRSDVIVCAATLNSPFVVNLFKNLKMDTETIPTPLAMVLSSNQVVTGIFTRVPKSDRLKEALLPDQPLAVRKSLQDGKTVLIKAQSKSTLGNKQTDQAILAYQGDNSISNKVVVLPVDLDKTENAAFLRQLKIDPDQEKQSVLICLAPPLKIVNRAFRGAATKDTIVKTTSAACGTGCSTGSS